MKSKWNSIFMSWKTSDGILLEVVKLGHRKNSMLRSMCTVDEVDFLFTVDSPGYVVVWGLWDATEEWTKSNFIPELTIYLVHL